MERYAAERAAHCLVRHENLFDAASWVPHVTTAEAADLEYAKGRIRSATLRAFGTGSPGRLRFWCFTLLCLGSRAARHRRAVMLAAYEAYIDQLEELRRAALNRASTG
jgi:hypothetical protein